MNGRNIDQIILIIDEVGYPVLMAIGMGYFIWYVWKYVCLLYTSDAADE